MHRNSVDCGEDERELGLGGLVVLGEKKIRKLCKNGYGDEC